MAGVCNGYHWRFEHRGSWFADLSVNGHTVEPRVPVAWLEDLRGGIVTIHFQKSADRDHFATLVEFTLAIAPKTFDRDGKPHVKELQTICRASPIAAGETNTLTARFVGPMIAGKAD
jgi:hypothetical protein